MGLRLKNRSISESWVRLLAAATGVAREAVESDAEKIEDPIIKKGLELVIDGTDPHIVESILRNMLDKEIRFTQTKYEAVIEAMLGVQEGDAPQILRQKMESRLP